jgi:hypothetical protein
MGTLEDYLVPPEAVRGMKVLDRTAFSREFKVPAIRLADPKHCSLFLKRLSRACLRFQPVKKVQTERSVDGRVRKLGKGFISLQGMHDALYSTCVLQARVCGIAVCGQRSQTSK